MDSAEFIINEVYMASCVTADNLFEKNYIRLRNHENRIYTDNELFCLPDIASSHIHYKEWQIRKRSCQRLISKLNNKKKALNILEVGCGNGWLSNQLSKVSGSSIIGLDINLTELQQAARVFRNNPKLQFIYGDLHSKDVENKQFDIIVFAASIQYFPSLNEIVDCSLSHLNVGGEIHIIDTPFYVENELSAAKQRMADYYSSSGLSEMKDYYFHHSMQELQLFDYRFLYNPGLLSNKLFKKNSPFPWICIQKG